MKKIFASTLIALIIILSIIRQQSSNHYRIPKGTLKDFGHTIYYYDKNKDSLIEIEKTSITYSLYEEWSGQRLFTEEISNATSRFKIMPLNGLKFVARMENIDCDPNQYDLLKVLYKNGQRVAFGIHGNDNFYGNRLADSLDVKIIPFIVRKLDKQVYELSVEGQLVPGEYVFLKRFPKKSVCSSIDESVFGFTVE